MLRYSKLLCLFGVASLLAYGCGSSGGDNSKESAAKDSSQSAAPVVANAEPAPNTLNEKEKSEGWQLLFDGNTKNGWHIYNKKSDGSAWKISDSSLYLGPDALKGWQASGGGDLVTDQEFENYDFKVDWKIADSGNSGIIFYVKEAPKYEQTWHTGIEMQVLDNAGHSDAKIPKHRAGDLYDLISSSPETVKPAGQWNQAEIIANKGKIECYLNGTKVISTNFWDDNWKKLIAGSKFKEFKDFGTFTKGHLALQDHGFKVWYRNIKIKTL